MTAGILKMREHLPSHPLFQETKNCSLRRIVSPADLKYHPDSILSALDFFKVYPNQMPCSGVYGEDFVAIKCASCEGIGALETRVECVYLRYIQGSWQMRRLGQSITQEEFQTFVKLANHEPVVLDGLKWQRG